MPIDDLLEWAAETNRYGSKPKKSSNGAADEPHSCLEYRPTINRSPSPCPKRDRLPKWYDIGHGAAACSGRCIFHAKHEQQDGLNEENGSPRDAVEPFQTPRRRHRRNGRSSFQRDDSQNVHLNPNSNPKISEAQYRNSRLDFAREALLNGNVVIAQAIVSEELERLSKTDGM